MKNQLLAILLVACALSVKAQTGTNPIMTHKYTADPNAIVANGRVYVYCSSDEFNTTSGYDLREYTLMSTDDMANWTDHGQIFKVPRDASWAGQAYAPAAIERNGKFYLYFPNGASSIGVAVSDKPEGPFVDALRKPLIDRNTPNANVPWLFDPAVFIDDNGQAYLYFGGGSSATQPLGQNLRVIKLNPNMISVDGPAISLTTPYSFEGPFMYKRNGKYYFNYPQSGAPNLGFSDILYLMADNPLLTGAQNKGVLLQNPRLNGVGINNNNSHTSIVDYKGKTYMFYHDRRASNMQTYYRSVSVDELFFNTDGTMKPVVVTTGVKQIKYLNPYDRIESETIYKQKGIETDFTNDGGGLMLTAISDGDWTSIAGVDFGTGTKKMNFRVASGSAGGTIEVRLGSPTGTLLGSCPISNSGSWTSWKTVTCNLSLISGIKDIYLVYKGAGEPFRLNWFTFIKEPTEMKGPYSGTAISIPGTIEAENYDKGGQGVSYNDTEMANLGNVYRTDGVDIDAIAGGGFTLGWNQTGEWTEYAIDVTKTGSYDFEFRYSAPALGGKLSVDLDGQELLSGLVLPSTTDWYIYGNFSKKQTLNIGKHILRLKIDQPGFNLDKIVVKTSVIAGIEDELNANNVSLFPNPSNDGVFYLSQTAMWKVYSLLGKELKTGLGTSIDIHEQPKGIYLIKLGNVIQRVLVE